MSTSVDISLTVNGERVAARIEAGATWWTSCAWTSG